MGFSIDYSPTLRRILSVGLAILLLIIPLTAFSYFVDRSSILKIPLNFYASLYFSLSIGSTTIYTTNLNLRLKTITEILALNVHKKSTKNIINVKSSDDREIENVYNTLAGTYSTLMDTCDDANLCCGFQMMLSFGLIFFYTLFTTFTAYTDLISEGTLTLTTINSAAFCVYYNFFLTVVVFTCTMVENQVKRLKTSRYFSSKVESYFRLKK
jgi:hypothetical protein